MDLNVFKDCGRFLDDCLSRFRDGRELSDDEIVFAFYLRHLCSVYLKDYDSYFDDEL